MKTRSNRDRLARKTRKSIETRDNRNKQVHINFHRKSTFQEIIRFVRSKADHLVLKNAHTRKKTKKQILKYKTLWSGRPYKRKIHGELRVSDAV